VARGIQLLGVELLGRERRDVGFIGFPFLILQIIIQGLPVFVRRTLIHPSVPGSNMFMQFPKCDRLRNRRSAEYEPAMGANPRDAISGDPVGSGGSVEGARSLTIGRFARSDAILATSGVLKDKLVGEVTAWGTVRTDRFFFLVRCFFGLLGGFP
jgi:hypothetical protein